MITIHRIDADGTETLVGGVGVLVAPSNAHKVLTGLPDGAYRFSRSEYAVGYARSTGGALKPCKLSDVLARRDSRPDEDETPPPPSNPET